jgi:hypothetical protein
MKYINNTSARSGLGSRNEKGGASRMARRIKVRGVRREELDTEKIAFVFWMMAKRQVQEKREREQQERDKNQARKAVSS